MRKRTEWLPRAPTKQKPSRINGRSPTPPMVADPILPVVMVPNFPVFSPAAVAHVLGRSRATVAYWLNNFKMDSYKDNLGERYILRAELVRFVREYLQREVVE